jgi:hypothetical protein
MKKIEKMVKEKNERRKRCDEEIIDGIIRG